MSIASIIRPPSLWVPSSAGGSSPYVAKAVHFDGNALLSTDNFSSFASTNVFSFSLWIKPQQQILPQTLFVTDPNNAYANALSIINRSPPASSAGTLELTNVDFSEFFSIQDISAVGLLGGWHSLMGNGNTSLGEGQLWLDDTPLIMSNTFDSAFAMVFDGLQQVVGGDTFAPNYLGDGADWWIAPGVFTNFSVEANRRFFISAEGKPVDPSGFPSSAILFSGDSSTFPVNQGTGGAFTLTGSLTNASTSPSD